MSNFVVDVESDGPAPGLFSMVSFGAVLVDGRFETSCYGEVKPISDKYDPVALAVSGVSREEHLKFACPIEVMSYFYRWVKETNVKGRPIMWSDNIAYDWQFINYYFHAFNKDKNPFGYSGRRIGDYYCGMKRDTRAPWKFLRKTKHTHHPVDDARGNAEAMWAMGIHN